MIVKISKKVYGTDKLINEYVWGSNVVYGGEILLPGQIKNLKELGNTILNNQILEFVPKQEICREVARILNCDAYQIKLEEIKHQLDDGTFDNTLIVKYIEKKVRGCYVKSKSN